MAVMVVLTLEGDPDRIQQALNSDPERLQAVSDRARGKGALHHAFYGNVDGSGVVVVDEWETAEAFQQFFAESQEIGQMMGEAGVTNQPVPTFWNKLDTPDAF
ncbi:MAG TPA: hypothetical protein VMB05_16775 [Solirubrobacteraceae bacterium]|nr:hypothetical protein [Solirubrobacteraceae bacterium]